MTTFNFRFTLYSIAREMMMMKKNFTSVYPTFESLRYVIYLSIMKILFPLTSCGVCIYSLEREYSPCAFFNELVAGSRSNRRKIYIFFSLADIWIFLKFGKWFFLSISLSLLVVCWFWINYFHFHFLIVIHKVTFKMPYN